MKFYFGTELAFKIITLQSFFYFKLFICPPDVKRSKYFRSFYPENPQQGSTIYLLQTLQHLENPTYILQHLKNSIFVQKRTLVKLPG